MRFYLLVLALFTFGNAAAQSVAMMGRVIDNTTGDPIPYATIQLVNSLGGTISNDNGVFALAGLPGDSLKISCLGYQILVVPVSDTLQTLTLTPKALVLDNVTILASELDPKKILNKAFKAIKTNFISEPFKMHTFYRHYCRDDTLYGRLIEAAVDVYKPKGYGKPKAFEAKNDARQLIQLRRSFDQTILKNGNHAPLVFDQILGSDLAAYQEATDDPIPFFFNISAERYMKRNLANYKLKLKGLTTYQGNDVYIIEFSSIPWWEKGMSTGILLEMKHSGEIYVQTNNYAFIKVFDQIKMGSISRITNEIHYQQHNQKYYLSHIIHDQYATPKSKPEHNAHIELMVNEIEIGKDKTFRDEPLTEKVLSTCKYDPEFWNEYTVITENPLEKNIRLHLERNETLTQQYALKSAMESMEWDKVAVSQQAVDKLIHNANGEIIYFDFWASWCSPCVSEFIKSSKTVDKYAAQGVRFVYVSIDAFEENWLQLKERYGLKNREHYRIGNQSDLMVKYKVSEIPRYMMLGADGKLLAHAPRPSSEEFIHLIESQLLKAEKNRIGE